MLKFLLTDIPITLNPFVPTCTLSDIHSQQFSNVKQKF